VELHGVEAAGEGADTPRHAATLSKGTPGVLHGARSYLLQTRDGQITEAHSISAGSTIRRRPGTFLAQGSGPGEVLLRHRHGSARRIVALSKLEGIIPALESAHAVAHIMRVAPQMAKDKLIAICLSGRGDKDVFFAAVALGEEI